MTVRYLFNTSGEYVAFLHGTNLFNPNGDWLGVLRNGNEVYNTDGLYIGLLLDDDRVVRSKIPGIPKRIPRPTRPLRPMKPLLPLRRLRMVRVPFPHQDIFEGVGTPVTRLVPLYQLKDLDFLLGASIIAADNQFLGLILKDSFSNESILNQFSPYGSQFSNTSMFNDFGLYGSHFSVLSPFNEFTSTPPRIEREGTFLGFLTVNQFLTPRIDTNEFLAWLNLEKV